MPKRNKNKPSRKPGYTFNPEPSEEVLRYIKNKGYKPAFSYKDVWAQEHAFQFTVAKAMKLDVLTAIHEELLRAELEGVPFERWAKDLKPKLQKMGWWGKRDMTDPKTGETVTAKLGSPRRLRTIYRANIRSARAAGQWDRAQRTREALPYFIYELGPSKNHREKHEAMSGLILPINDPYWATHYPPNGWGCKCRVRQITEAEAKRRGISKRPRVQKRTWTNNRTGEVLRVPKGIDPGWDTNAGLHRQRNMDRFLRGKLDAAPEPLARVAAFDLVRSWKFNQIQKGNLKGSVPAAVLPKVLQEVLGSQSRVVLFSEYTAAKALRKHANLNAQDYLILQRMLDRGEVMQQTPRNLIVQASDKSGKWWRAVVKKTQDSKELFLSTFHRISPLHRRRGLRLGKKVRGVR